MPLQMLLIIAAIGSASADDSQAPGYADCMAVSADHEAKSNRPPGEYTFLCRLSPKTPAYWQCVRDLVARHEPYESAESRCQSLVGPTKSR